MDSTARGLVVALTFAAACSGGGGEDPIEIDASEIDARVIDARPPIDAGIDARRIDAAPPFACHNLDLTAEQACAAALTGAVTPCSVANGVPSQTGALEIHRADGNTGYLCTTGWVDIGGFYFQADRRHFRSSATQCCGGAPAPFVDWPATDAYFGVPHAPVHIKVQEMEAPAGGKLVHNPFAIVVSNATVGATVHPQRLAWLAWAGDGLPHPAPDGTGQYWFPAPLPINYVIVPTGAGDPLIIVAPEVMVHPTLDRPLGHPTMGACPGTGGTPVAFLGGTIEGTILTNRSGRFGRETSITSMNMMNAAALFNCYGINITGVSFDPP